MRELTQDGIKPRLLGHWGTCPGLVLIYVHLNRIIRRTNQEMLCVPLVTAPGVLECLWLEDSLSAYYPQYSCNKDGLHGLTNQFSVPNGFSRHVSTFVVPGCIHKGVDVGYAPSAAMDRPDFVVTCVVGDGEAETRPTATAWHATESGAVLPIFHLNGFKISERTIYSTMDDKEICGIVQLPLTVTPIDLVRYDFGAEVQLNVSTDGLHSLQDVQIGQA
ncbi:XFP N-terminal domain-containing protein [Multifurca ochricompacta]|uniref:XFP N-terminal domain-containing protein n=1 Tax=Multifurca ochricompacta TaxID=376703 RepID=A0AAD4LW28_9AGAM|nr:XFP N-terminal domain-containing protein [Multifurca ochricompacta]